MRNMMPTFLTACLAAVQALAQATLPTTYSGPWAAGALPTGWAKTGLGTDYAADLDGGGDGSAKLDSTGDSIAINYDSAATSVTYWLKGNPSAGSSISGTFTVEESADGSAWSALETYLNLSNVTVKRTNTPAGASRYLRFIYTSKTSGNVGLDGIAVEAGGGSGPVTNAQFNAGAASAGESSSSYTVTVYKTVADGNVSGEIELGGTATEGAGNDYTVDTTNFTMNGAATSATFVVTLNDDAVAEPAETVILSLRNVSGGGQGSPSAFTLTLTDNDAIGGSLLISQYTETDVGSTPKGIEIWNSSGAPVTFDGAASKLDIKVGFNGGALGTVYSITNGSLGAGSVMVVGTADMTPTHTFGFTFNGDDAVSIELGGVVQDVLGQPGVDPGAAWNGSGVSTSNQNIQLKSGFTIGDPDGWTDPSTRFETVGAGSLLTGFGSAPGSGPVTNARFAQATAAVGEASVAYTVTVYKTVADGTVSGEIGLGGTATEGAGSDYTIDTTNFTMNGAVTSATFVVTINEDAAIETNETVTLSLAHVVGGGLGSPSVFALTINDNDAAPATPEGLLAFRFTANPHLQVTTKESNFTVSVLSISSGSIGTNITAGTAFPDRPYVQSSGGWTNADQTSAKRFLFTVTPDSGYQVTITGISFRAYATGAGPSVLGYDIGGLATLATNAPDSVLLVVSQAVAGVVNQTGPVVVQIQGWTNGSRATAGTGDFRLDDVVLFGTVESSGPPPTNVHFMAASASVGEASVAYTVTVHKTVADGNMSGEIVLGGTATEGAGADYTVDATNFILNGAATSATFVVTINDDAVVESNETIVLSLANVVGGTMAAPSAFALTLTDNDIPPPPSEGILAFRFSANPHLQATTKEAHIAVSALSVSSGSIATNITVGTYFPNMPYVQSSGGWTNSAQNGSKRFLFTITPDAGYQVTITGISFRAYATPAGPSAMGYDIDGVATSTVDMLDSTLTVVSQAVAGVDNRVGPVVVQIQGWTNSTRSTPGTGDLRLDDVVIFGMIQALAGTDDDHDGLPNDWEAQYFSTATAGHPSDDDDGDHVANIDEYVAGTIPVGAAGSTNFLRALSFLAGSRTVGYPSVTGRVYRLEALSDLRKGTNWTSVAGPQTGDGLTQTLQDSSGTTSSVYRISVGRP